MSFIVVLKNGVEKASALGETRVLAFSCLSGQLKFPLVFQLELTMRLMYHNVNR